jgi:hypothetical protein
MATHDPTTNRRAFLHGLTTLPLIGGGEERAARGRSRDIQGGVDRLGGRAERDAARRRSG